MEKDFYTELTYKRRCPDDFGPTVISHREQCWDGGMGDMLEMFHTLMIGATFHERSFQDALGEYLIERGWDVITPEEVAEMNKEED